MSAPVSRVLVSVALSPAELVAALFVAIPPEANPLQLDAAEVDEALACALLVQGASEVQDAAFRLATDPPSDPDGRTFLAGCQLVAARRMGVVAALSR